MGGVSGCRGVVEIGPSRLRLTRPGGVDPALRPDMRRGGGDSGSLAQSDHQAQVESTTRLASSVGAARSLIALNSSLALDAQRFDYRPETVPSEGSGTSRCSHKTPRWRRATYCGLMRASDFTVSWSYLGRTGVVPPDGTNRGIAPPPSDPIRIRTPDATRLNVA